MPPYSSIALRYLAWLVGLRALYALAIVFAGVPQALASDVILAAAPVMAIATYTSRNATRPLVLSDWVVVWAICLGIFALLLVAVPLAIAVNGGADIATSGALRQSAMGLSATAVMMAIFLAIGTRIRR